MDRGDRKSRSTPATSPTPPFDERQLRQLPLGFKMPATEIITIINNSGKVISTVSVSPFFLLLSFISPLFLSTNTRYFGRQGKHLVGIFKEAKAAYREKREAIKEERAERRGIQRARTFDVNPRSHHDRYHYEYEIEEELDHNGHGHGSEFMYGRRAIQDAPDRRRSQEDDRSQASSHRSHRSRRPRPRSADRARPALTESNLRTHSEVSVTPPSAAPPKPSYRSPYAETAPRDMQLSRPNLVHAATMPASPTQTTATTPVSTPRQSMLVHRPRSDVSVKKKKEIDMHLAYGNVPPDLASRVDLEPKHRGDMDVVSRDINGNGDAHPDEHHEQAQEEQAFGMVDRIEGLLEEAQCVHHTASSMIANLQQNPEAAAAVALTLAELSALIGKMSPAFLGMLKGSSPAIFALLASPQFLIGTSIALGVTVVIFGGWKIVKRIREANAKEKEQPIEMQTMSGGNGQQEKAQPNGTRNGNGDGASSYEEALVLEEELSTIETWRRGIQAYGVDEEEETADVELMSPEADRALREKWRDEDRELDPDDSVSRVGSTRTRRSHRSSHGQHRPGGSSRRHHTSRHHRSHDDEDEDVQVPERKSSRRYRDKDGKEGAESEVAESVRSHRSHRSSRSHASKYTSRTTVKAIEETKEEEDGEGDAVLKPKEKKRDLLMQMFKKKKDKEDEKEKEKVGKAMSVLV